MPIINSTPRLKHEKEALKDAAVEDAIAMLISH
jgi:hypothetical protein